jgi:hypothetical protein
MTTLNNAITRIDELLGKGLERAKIEATLILEDYPKATIKEAFKALSVKPKAATFASEFYTFLGSNPRTKEEAEEYIMGGGMYGETSANVKKHLSHYMNIWALTSTIWEGKADEPKMDENVKAAWDHLNAAKKRYADGVNIKKTTVHPDKVSHLGDAELTNAYKEFFQTLNK